MPDPLRTLAAPLLTIFLAAGCSGPLSQSRSVAGYAPVGNRGGGSGVVLSGQALRESSGTLLSFLDSRLSGMVVEYDGRACPFVLLRGRKSLFGPSDPVVYVNGARAVNTCVLDMLSPRDVASVEVYPMGVSHRPGYTTNAGGLILVFLDDGSQAKPE